MMEKSTFGKEANMSEKVKAALIAFIVSVLTSLGTFFSSAMLSGCTSAGRVEWDVGLQRLGVWYNPSLPVFREVLDTSDGQQYTNFYAYQADGSWVMWSAVDECIYFLSHEEAPSEILASLSE